MKKDARIFVAVSEDMIGAAFVRRLRNDGCSMVIASHEEDIDLLNQAMVSSYFATERPEYVFLPSFRVGGILANNSFPAEFIFQNITCQTNIINAALLAKTKKLLYIGSSCVYPKECPQPMKEEYLLTGKLEPTSEPYSIAKIAGITMCRAYQRQYGCQFISTVPADVYGPEDDFDPETAHVLPALIARMDRAKKENAPEVVLWGTGTPRREAFYIDDLVDAGIHLMDHYEGPDMINTGYGVDVSIREMAEVIRKTVGYEGKLVFDETKPDGTPRKFLDTSRMRETGWAPKTGLEEGVKKTFEWYNDHYKQLQNGE